jgi:hypothetical protein
MGLDQSAFRVPKSDSINATNVKDNEYKEIQYWRKCWPFQDWMTRLYRRKGGKSEFNCEYVQLEKEDLDLLEEDIPNLKEDTYNCLYPGDIDELPKFIANARKVLEEGDLVYYWSWW